MAANHELPAVIKMSLRKAPSRVIAEAAERVMDAGVIVVVAALPRVITVGASDSNDDVVSAVNTAG